MNGKKGTKRNILMLCMDTTVYTHDKKYACKKGPSIVIQCVTFKIISKSLTNNIIKVTFCVPESFNTNISHQLF